MNRGNQSQGGTNSGRHRHGDTGTWTPSVPSQGGTSRHEPSHDGEPTGPTCSQGRIAGELPIPQQGIAAQGAPENVQAQQGPKRTRVTFTRPEQPPAAAPEGPPEQEEEPAQTQDTSETGLGVFDLGSVPASVTPPRTWRKAAWFAAGSSGGVMGLLFAGSFLLAQQPPDSHAAGEWTYLNRGEDAPLLRRDDLLRGPTQPRGSPENTPRDSSTTTTTTSRSGESSPPGSDRPTPTSSRGSTGYQETSSTRSSGTGHRTGPSSTVRTTQPPEKPPPTTAPSQVVNRQPTLYSARNTDQMSQRSQKFLNTVTENPQEAYELTSGQLHDKGADGLRRKYSDVAYFEVKKVVINQGKGVTVNTVKAVYNDRHTETQRITLTFDENGKISKASG